MPEQMFLYDEKKPLSLNGFSRKDCIFEGWKLNGLLIGKDGEEVKNLASQEGAVVVLKASWKRGRYEIRYHGNGGTGKVDSQTGKCGLTKKLRKNDFERTGYRFVGWNTKKDGTGVTYKEGSEVQSSVAAWVMWSPCMPCGKGLLIRYVTIILTIRDRKITPLRMFMESLKS